MQFVRFHSDWKSRYDWVVVLVAIAIFGLATANAVVINPGSDLFQTPASNDSPFPTYQDFSGPTTLPPGFFGAGSDQFTGRVYFRGTSLSGTGLDPDVDTIVERTEATVDLACGASDTVDIIIRGLSLASELPITVTFGGGASSSQYSVSACLADSPTLQTPGSMTIQVDSTEGGSFQSTLPVAAKLTFTKVSGASGLASVELDPAPTMTFSADGYWSLTDPFDMPPFDGIFISPGGVVDHDCNAGTGAVAYAPSTPNFFAGVRWEGPSDCTVLPPSAGRAYRKVLTQEQALLASHGVKVVNINKKPIPTVSEWGVAALSMLVLVAGTVVLRRSTGIVA